MSELSPPADGCIGGSEREGRGQKAGASRQSRSKGRPAAGKKKHVPRFPELPPKYR